MDVAEVLYRCGGVATTEQLCARTSAGRLRRAVRDGQILRVGRGHYALPSVGDARQAAARVNGVVSHLSAALHWNMPVQFPPEVPSVTVPRSRNLAPGRAVGIDVHYGHLGASEVVDGVTSPLRTVIDCARALPFPGALAVADSALRLGRTSQDDLLAAARAAPRTGRAKALRVAREAHPRAANPFESVLRGIGLEAGVRLTPQLRCAEFVSVDLGSEELRMVVEAESYAFHGSKEMFRYDTRRYTSLVRARWIVSRFVWEDVMYRPEEVGEALAAIAAWCTELRQLGRPAA